MRHKIWSLPAFTYIPRNSELDYCGLSTPPPWQFTTVLPIHLTYFTLQHDWPTRVLVENSDETQWNAWTEGQEHPDRYFSAFEKKATWDFFAEGLLASMDSPNKWGPDHHYWLTTIVTSSKEKCRNFQIQTIKEFAQSLLADRQPTPRQRLAHMACSVLRHFNGRSKYEDIGLINAAAGIAFDYGGAPDIEDWISKNQLKAYCEELEQSGVLDH